MMWTAQWAMYTTWSPRIDKRGCSVSSTVCQSTLGSSDVLIRAGPRHVRSCGNPVNICQSNLRSSSALLSFTNQLSSTISVDWVFTNKIRIWQAPAGWSFAREQKRGWCLCPLWIIASPTRLDTVLMLAARDLHAMLCAAVLESEDRGGNVSLRGYARWVARTSVANWATTDH